MIIADVIRCIYNANYRWTGHVVHWQLRMEATDFVSNTFNSKTVQFIIPSCNSHA